MVLSRRGWESKKEEVCLWLICKLGEKMDERKCGLHKCSRGKELKKERRERETKREKERQTKWFQRFFPSLTVRSMYVMTATICLSIFIPLSFDFSLLEFLSLFLSHSRREKYEEKDVWNQALMILRKNEKISCEGEKVRKKKGKELCLKWILTRERKERERGREKGEKRTRPSNNIHSVYTLLTFIKANEQKNNLLTLSLSLSLFLIQESK